MPIWFPETSEKGGSCLEALGEGTKRNGVWSMFSLDMKEMAPGREGVEACFVHVFVQLFGSTPGKRYRFYELGVLCLGIYGTWNAGRADAGAGAVSSISG